MLRLALRRLADDGAAVARCRSVWLPSLSGPVNIGSGDHSASILSGKRTASTSADGRKLVKRKVAIVSGYRGTGYHGVQLNKDVDTIEDEIRKAILNAGAMRESNFVDLAKIDWSRSSRTDKGVHAGCIVFSGKLLIDEDANVDPVTGRVKGLTEALNASLPPTIRVFSCTRVNKRFAARKNCVLREYEYFMPLSFLQSSVVAPSGEPLDTDEAVDAFLSALRRYEGIHDFHNFTKSRSHFYKIHAQRIQQQASQDSTQNQPAQEVMLDAEDGDDDDEGQCDPDASDDYSASQFGNQEETFRNLLPRHRRAIYSCSGSVINDFYGERFVRVHIVGQAFLFNQIRCMIGGALAVATKGLSQTAFDAALNTNRIVRVPIAPAEGLVLLSSTFGGKLHTVSLYEDPNTALARERKDLSHRTLLNREEDSAMQKFREEVIYKEIVDNWNLEGNLSRWRTYLERVYESNEHLDDDELGELVRGLASEKLQVAEKRQAFLHRNRVELAEGGIQGALLPKQFTTKLCVRFAVAPGIFTSDLRRAVSKHLKLGKIPLDSNEEAILTYIEQFGVKKLAEEGRRLRLSIRS